ncbi:MAG: ABC transporter ATP-binding protein [Sphingobium sp.]|nr:ABC transporter ATP-binding protein [Sphingobium sp.]MBP9156514.1 ABC transporter ATP-binding protein [Sphingobium sp.]
MIKLHNIYKYYPFRNGSRRILENLSLEIAMGDKVGILGKNGAGKSTLTRILSGSELPSSGNVIREMSISWPLAFGGAFQGGLTGLDNLKFISRVYGADISVVRQYVEEFSELGKYLYEPIMTYSTGMRARLAFALSMAIDFDCYLMDEIVAVGDRGFQEKCHEQLFIKRKHCAMVIVSHDFNYIREHCQSAFVLSQGKTYQFSDIEEAIYFYERSFG